MATLIIDNTETTSEVVIEGPRITVGREVTNDVVLSPSYVSRFHAQIEFDGQSYVLSDLNSSNGTLLNGRVCDRQVLKHGDRVQIGAIVMTFLCKTDANQTKKADPSKDEDAAGTRMLPSSSAKIQIPEPPPEIKKPKDPVAEIENMVLKSLRDSVDLAPAATIEADAEKRHKAMEFIKEILDSLKEPLPPGVKRADLARSILTKALPLGLLDGLLLDPSISAVYINNPDQIYVSKGGKIRREKSSFDSEEQVMAILDRLASSSGKRIQRDRPMTQFNRSDGLKIQAILPPFASRGPSLVIKKAPKKLFTLEMMVDSRSITAEISNYLKGCVLEKKNIVIMGDVSTGKTSLLKALCANIPPQDRVVILEELGELDVEHANSVSLELSPSDPSGREGVFAAEIALCAAMRLAPERLIVGELTQGVAPALFAAVAPGFKGLMTTCYATSPKHFIFRMEGLLAIGMGVQRGPELAALIASTVDVLIELRISQTRLPTVSNVFQLVGVDKNRVSLKRIFQSDLSEESVDL